MKKLTFLVGLIYLTVFSLFGQNTQVQSEVSWSDGLKFTFKPDSIIKEIKFGGRLMYDATFFHQDEDVSAEVGEFKNALELRRVRLFNSGKLFKGKFNYKLQLDFAGGEVAFKDAYLEQDIMKLSDRFSGKIRLGQFKEPLRMEVQLSSNNMSFIERSYITGFSPERNTGFMYHIDDKSKQFSFQLGIFGNGNDAGNDIANKDGFNITSRVTYAFDVSNESLLHLGLGFSHRDAGEVGQYGYSTRPPAHTAPKYLNVKLQDVNSSQLLNPELVFISQNLMIEAEYLMAHIDASNSYNFGAFYGQVSYFLNKKYHHSYKGAYSGISEEVEAGAIEIAARYSAANLNDGSFTGGKISDITFGINYYLNQSTRIMANYSFIDLDGVGKATDLNLRFMTYF